MRLDAVVRNRHNLSWNQAREWIETGKVWLGGQPVTDPAQDVEADAAIELKMNAPRPGKVLVRFDVVHQDAQLVVVNKPAGLSTVPYEENEVALEQLVNKRLKGEVSVVQRLDRETSGLLVFARTHSAAISLSEQFRAHTVVRRYFALAHGKVRPQTIRSSLVENRGDGLRGSGESGKPAVTHVQVLKHFEGMSLIECRLETGRTHQIRIHLSEAGHPLLGEKAYIREYEGPKIAASRLMLHAAELGFRHPHRDEPVRWTQLPPGDFLAPLPADAQALLAQRLTRGD